MKLTLNLCLLLTFISFAMGSPRRNVQEGSSDNSMTLNGPAGGKRDYTKLMGIDKKQHEQFMRNRKPVNITKPKRKAHHKTPKGVASDASLATPLPDSYDWRDQNDCQSLKDIRSQYCGNCWASAAASTMGDRYCIMTQKTKFFSEAQLTRCASNNGGCNGGNSDKAFNYYANTGVVSGGDEDVSPKQPIGCLPKSYLDKNSDSNACPTECLSSDDSMDQTYGTSVQVVDTASNEGITMAARIEKIKAEVYEYGPVVVYIQAYSDFASFKGTSVYVHDSSLNCDPPKAKDDCLHAIRILGWGTDDSGTDYWLCANQWGTGWGDNGMIKIKQGITDQSGVDWFTAWAYPKEAFS